MYILRIQTDVAVCGQQAAQNIARLRNCYRRITITMTMMLLLMIIMI